MGAGAVGVNHPDLCGIRFECCGRPGNAVRSGASMARKNGLLDIGGISYISYSSGHRMIPLCIYPFCITLLIMSAAVDQFSKIVTLEMGRFSNNFAGIPVQ